MTLFGRRTTSPPNLRLPVFDERGGAFAALRNRRVLIYWPHGFGDFVHLSYVVPMLEPSNQYYLTRFGDDFVHLYDEGSIVTPMFSGERSIGDGSAYGARHFGLDFRRLRNREEALYVPEPLLGRMRDERVDAMLYTDYPEHAGGTAYPYHTKARALAGALVASARLGTFDLSRPLRSSLGFDAPDEPRTAVLSRLRSFVEPGRPLYAIAPGGHTNAAKTLAAREVVELAGLLRKRDARARIITIDERPSLALGATDNLVTTADLFGDLDVPFAHVLTTVIRASHAFIGVPSGPLHAALAIGERPIVGIWLAHFPDWYDEPCASAVALAGPELYRKRLDRRPASQRRPAALEHRIVAFRERAPRAKDVLEALESLGG
ncbi:MAG: glycosyltransferase family 9 protein [Vulcanimicrobiaceae bacterium]